MADDVTPADVNWDDPETCPWCGADLTDGGAGFVAHAESNPVCADAFEAWRENVAGDVGEEWSG